MVFEPSPVKGVIGFSVIYTWRFSGWFRVCPFNFRLMTRLLLGQRGVTFIFDCFSLLQFPRPLGFYYSIRFFLCFARFALSARGVLRWLRSLFQAVYICPTLGVFVVGTKQLASEGGCVRLSFLRFAGFALCARVLCLVSHRLKWCFAGCKRFSRLFSDALLQFSSW